MGVAKIIGLASGVPQYGRRSFGAYEGTLILEHARIARG